MNTITDIIKPELHNLEAILSLSNNNNVATLALQELNYLEQQAVQKPIIAQCEKNSIILAVKNVLRKNLSLDPSAGLVYIKTRSVSVNNTWVTVLEIQETANGLLSYNRQLGRILDYENPQVKEDATGKTIGVSMKILKPSPLGPRWETYSFNEGDFLRWRRASHKENKRGYKPNNGKPVPNDDDTVLNYANPNYTNWKGGLDPEFARAKCIRHSLKKLGSNPNEGIGLMPMHAETPINATTAIIEAEDHDFTPHEEINTQINEPQTNFSGGTATPPAGNDFIAEDL